MKYMAKAAVEMMASRIENEQLPAEKRLFPGSYRKALRLKGLWQIEVPFYRKLSDAISRLRRDAAAAGG